MTGRAIRSVGSSFDIDLYTQMQLQDDNDSLEDEMRRSYSNPLPVDGAMDLPSPSGPATQARFVPPQERDVVRATNYIPELTFRQPTFEITSDLGLPAPRPLAGEGRKVSHYTHPRPAHVPPPTSNVDVKASRYTDATGRPLSPSKSRIRQNALRAPLQNLPPRPTEEEDDDILLPYLSEEHAERILREDASVLTGYGTAVR